MKLKILITDDEPLARERLKSHLQNDPKMEVVAEAENGEQCLEMFNKTTADVVLLDIRMPGMDGMEVAAELQKLEQPPIIIFTTAYEDHALEAFQHQAIAYLLKPIKKAKLYEALEQGETLLAGRAQKVIQAAETAYISTYDRGVLLRIPVKDIRYLQADQKYVSAHFGEQAVLIEDSLVSIEQRFPGLFLRVHRNALVSPALISGIEKDAEGRHFVRLSDGHDKVEVSRRNLSHIRQYIRNS